MFCKNCGNKFTVSDKFCDKCGTPVSPIEQPLPYKKVNPGNNYNIGYSRSYIADIIRSKSQRRLFFGFALVIIAIVFFISRQNYLSNLFSGPRATTGETLEKELTGGNIKDININLELEPDSVYSTGYTHITQTIDQNTNQIQSTATDNQYYITIIGKHLLVLEGDPVQMPNGKFSGVIIPLRDDLHQKLITDFSSNPDLADLIGSIVPYMLSNKGMTGLDDFWVILFAFALLCLGAYISLRRAFDLDDRNHYLYKILASSGYYDINDLSEDFVKSQQSILSKVGGFKLNNNFIFHESFFFFQAYPLSEMFWAYKKVIQRKMYGVIPTGKSFAVVLNFKPKQVVEIAGSESKVNEYLILLSSLCPQAEFGYNKQ